MKSSAKSATWMEAQSEIQVIKGLYIFCKTSKFMHTRMKGYKSQIRSKKEKVREGSALYIHIINEHPDTELEGKHI